MEETFETYGAAVDYINATPKFTTKNSMEDTARFWKRLGYPAKNGNILHIAGTNGKGSVCAYLRGILMESGYTVGLFTSPHLETMRERICLGEEKISKEKFTEIFEKVKDKAVHAKEMGLFHPSFFEFLFLMAMVYFKEKNPDYIILETGLGGRLDATNCIKPDICVITEIGYDHMQYLGNTIREIAAEKAGIIKPGVPVVFVDKRTESTEVLTEYAKKMVSPVVKIGKDNILNVNINNKNIDFSLRTGYYNYVSLFLKTRALYQVENASLAVAAAERLRDEQITPEAIRKGLWEAKWPGRMEEALPGIVLDGAHNEDGIDAFLNTVKEDACKGERLLLFGVVMDKQYQMMISQIARSGFFARMAVTALETDRSASLNQLKAVWSQYKTPCSFFENAEEAYNYLKENKGREDIIYVVGSLYLIGQIKSFMRRIQDDRF